MASTGVRTDLLAKQFTSYICPVLLLWTIAYLLGWSVWLVGFYLITPYFAPFWLGPYVLTFIKCSLMDSTLPLHVRTSGPTRLFYHFFVKQPAFNIAWWIDEILFPLYHLTKINSPTFLLGQPRSGTTKLLDLLATNEQHVVALTFWEISYPILWIQYVAEYFNQYNEKYFHGKLRALFDPINDDLRQVDSMHRMNMDNWEEDNISFLLHFSFSLAGFQEFPIKECMNLNLNFHSLDMSLRRRLFDFHRKMVQKILYKRGNAQSIYMAKWVMCWTGEYEHIQEIYPNARFVFIYRKPQESIPSFLKLLSAISFHTTSYDPFTNPVFKNVMLNYLYRAHEVEVEFMERLLRQKNHVQIIEFSRLFEDIPETVKRINTKLQISQPKEYQNFLLEQQVKQLEHRKTKIVEPITSESEIEKHCPTFYEKLTFLMTENEVDET